jgi:hypothetical protein
MYKRFFSTLIIFALSFLFLKTNNQEIFAYNIEPAIREFILQVEDEKTGSIFFTNTSENQQEFKVYSHRYNPKTESIIDDRDFIELNNEFFTLQSGERIEIEYSIKIPEDVLGGSYFSIIAVEEIQHKNLEPTTIAINYGVGSLIAIHVVNDTDISEIFLNEIEIDLKYKQPLNPLKTEIEYRIQNSSKYTFLPKGQLTITSTEEKPIYFRINTEEHKLYPEDVLSFSFTHEGEWKDLLKNKKIVSRIGSQFSNDLREIQTDLPYLNQTVLAISTLIFLIATLIVLIKARKKKKKTKKK